MRAEWAGDGGRRRSSAPQRAAGEPCPLPRCPGRVRARRRGGVGRRPVRELPRRGHPAVLRARLRRCRRPPLRADDERGGSPNAWGLPDDMTITLHGDALRPRLADDLIGDGFDIAYSYRKREGSHFPHAILNTQLFLDYDHAGRDFHYPLIPITVNCYGQHAIARRGGLARFAEIADEQLDPSGPTPARCFALGRRSPGRLPRRPQVALVASSSWSHAFLTDKTGTCVPTPPPTAGCTSVRRRDYTTGRGHRQRHRRRRPARDAQLVLPVRRDGRARPAAGLVDPRHHRCLQLQQVLRDLRRKGRT